MRGMSDCDPCCMRRLILGALPEWPAAIPFALVMAGLILLTCTA